MFASLATLARSQLALSTPVVLGINTTLLSYSILRSYSIVLYYIILYRIESISMCGLCAHIAHEILYISEAKPETREL